MSDEHTRSIMGAYGNPVVKTPNLDNLANNGMRFNQAYTPSPICISARASFATGTQVFEHQCWDSAQPYYGQHESWMQRLTKKGHEVVSIGKLHYRGADDDTGFSNSQHAMYVTNDGNGWPPALLRKPLTDFPQAANLAAEIGPGETDYTQYDRNITSAAKKWLSTPRPTKMPWVLFISFICPHYPLIAPREFYDLYNDIELPQSFDNDGNHLRHPIHDQMREFWCYNDFFDANTQLNGLRNYYGLCSFLDDNVGQVLDVLKASGHADNTQIIYTSDHGDMTGNHGIWCKSYMYEDSVGIPLTITGPGIDKGTNNTPVSLVDIATTVESFVTDEKCLGNTGWKGQPLTKFIHSPDPDRIVISEYHDGGSPTGVFMLRKRDWKLIYFAGSYPSILFNLKDDPWELTNLAENQSEVCLHMESLLREIMDPEDVDQKAFDDQTAKIRALGGIDVIRNMQSFNHTPVE